MLLGSAFGRGDTDGCLLGFGRHHDGRHGTHHIGIGCASFTALAGLNLVEDYFEAARKALEDKEDYVETEVVK